MPYPPPRADDAEGIRILRSLLDRAGFTAAGVERALELEGPFDRAVPEEPRYLRLLPEGEALSTFVKLFLVDVPVPASEAGAALAPLSLERAERMGLLRLEGHDCRATVDIAPADEFLLASDQGREHANRPEHVLGFSPPTRVLASLTVRRPVETALDVGTGSGLQALAAAGHAGRVVGVDINPRALRYAEFNAVLNDAPNLEFREGSLFEPVAGETFDLIVANPPYIVSPETEFVFRDSGLPGDSFCEGLIRQLPGHLREGGFGHALVAWVHGRDQDWTGPLRTWVAGSGCDAVLFRYQTYEPLAYAAGWNRPRRDDPAAYAEALDRWLAYYDELGIEAISWGAIVLRRRSGGRNWVFAHSPAAGRIGTAGDHVLRLFAAQDLLAAEAEEALLAERLALAADHRFEQAGRLGEGRGDESRTVLALQGGMRFQLEVDDVTVLLLSRLDGSRELGQVLADVAEFAHGGLDEFVANALPQVRRLLELGFVVRADARAPAG